MSALLKIVGLVWAVIGLANYWILAMRTPPVSSSILSISLLFQVMVFIIPGLLLAGIGAVISKKKKPPKAPSKPCPYCAEDIKPEAILCRHCGKDLVVPSP